jgi:hypothetical protein
MFWLPERTVRSQKLGVITENYVVAMTAAVEIGSMKNSPFKTRDIEALTFIYCRPCPAIRTRRGGTLPRGILRGVVILSIAALLSILYSLDSLAP